MSMSSVLSHHEPDTPEDLSAMSPNWMKIDGNRISKAIYRWRCQLPKPWLPWTAGADIHPSTPPCHHYEGASSFFSGDLAQHFSWPPKEEVKGGKVTFPISSIFLFYLLLWGVTYLAGTIHGRWWIWPCSSSVPLLSSQWQAHPSSVSPPHSFLKPLMQREKS